MVDRQVSHTVGVLGSSTMAGVQVFVAIGGPMDATESHMMSSPERLVRIDKGCPRVRVEEKRAGREGTGSIQGYNTRT